MPLYDYECAACGRRFEVFHGVHAEGPTSCPLCGEGPVRKVITAAAVHYRGSGWAKKERRTAASKTAEATAGDGASGDGGKEGGSTSGRSKSDAPGDGSAAATPGGSGASAGKGKSSKASDKTAAATGD